MATHDFAANDVIEAGFLSRISENLSGHEAFAAYAAWLSEFDAPASAFVRAYSEHESGQLPPPGSLAHRSAAWHRMLGCTFGPAGRSWRESIREVPATAQATVESLVRPIVTMTATKCALTDLSLGESRFLGAPDLPKEFAWPTCARGPLRFQAQINLSDLRYSVATQRYGLPTEGWLLLFAFDDNGETGIQPGVGDRGDDGKFAEIPDLTHVAYVPATAALVRISVPAETISYRGNDFACALKFGESFDVPWAADTEDPQLESDVVADWLSDLRGSWSSKLMGYPLHCRTDNTSPGPNWINLITLGSDDETGWSWCDGEHLDVYVHEDGIANRSFRPFYGYAA